MSDLIFKIQTEPFSFLRPAIPLRLVSLLAVMTTLIKKAASVIAETAADF